MSAFGSAGAGASTSPMVPSIWNRDQKTPGGPSTTQAYSGLGMGQAPRSSTQAASSSQTSQPQQQVERQPSFTFGGSMPQPFRSFQQQDQFFDAQPSQQPQVGAHGQQQAPYSSAPTGYSQPGYAQPSGPQLGMPRSSSFRTPRRSDGPASASPMNAFNLGSQADVSAQGQSPQQAKMVRWSEAPEQQGMASTSSIYPSFQQRQTSYSAPPQTQQMGQPQQGSAMGYSQYSMPAQQPAQTPARPQPQSFASFGGAHNQPGASQWSTPAAQTQQTQQTPKSAFGSSLASIAKPVTTLTSGHRAPTATPARGPETARTSASSIAASIAAAAAGKVGGNTAPKAPQTDTTQVAEGVITPRPAIVARVKWNAALLAVCWLAPRFGPVSTIYYGILDLTYRMTGGTLDLQLAAMLSWIRTAIFLVAFVNLTEAIIRLQTQSGPAVNSPSTAPDTQKSVAAGAANAKRKPSLQCPPSRAASTSLSPAPTGQANTAVSRRSVPRQFAQDSPLRDSIFRASISSQQEGASRAGSPALVGSGRRAPSETPRLDDLRTASGSMRKPSSSATPLAAYLARKQERIASGYDFSDLSFEGGNSSIGDISNLSSDSIDIDRALRAISVNYGRELSQGRSSASPGMAAA